MTTSRSSSALHLWHPKLERPVSEVGTVGPRSSIRAALSPDLELWITIDAPAEVQRLIEATQFGILPMAIAAAAMRGLPISVAEPVSDGWWLNLVGGFLPLAQKLWDFHQIDVTRERRSTTGIPRSGDLALMFSAGVDSFYSLDFMQKAGVPVTHLLNINAGAHRNPTVWRIRLDNVRAAAAKMNASVITIDTNFHHAVPLSHAVCHALRNLSASFALYPAITQIVYSSTHEFGGISFNEAKVLGESSRLDHVVASTITPEEIGVSLIGWNVNRINKIKALTSNPIAQEHLDICTNPSHLLKGRTHSRRNCGRCKKCIRSLLTIEHFGFLDAFDPSFSIRQFREDRSKLVDVLAGSDALVDREVIALVRGSQTNARDHTVL